jgi:hypothetical protein
VDRRLRLIAALVFGIGTFAMVVAEELDLLVLVAALLFAAVITAAAFAVLALARRRQPTAALVIGLLAATPLPWSWGPHNTDSGWVALWETPRLVVASDAAPLLPYVSDTLD